MTSGKTTACVIPRTVAIRSERDLDSATRELCKLISLGAGLSPSDVKRFRALTDAIESYERLHHPIPEPTHAALLEHLMDAKGVGLAQLAKATNLSRAALSSILKGTRRATKKEAEGLARFFRVEPSVFANAPALTMQIVAK